MRTTVPLFIALWLVFGALSSPVWAQDAQTIARAEEHSRLGVQYYQEKRYAEAIREMLAAHQLVPDPGLLYNIGRIYQEMGEPELALEYLTLFVKDPGADPARVQKALGHMQGLRDEIRAAKAAGGGIDGGGGGGEGAGGGGDQQGGGPVVTPERDLTLVWVAGGVGAAALVSGVTLGLLAQSDNDTLSQQGLPYERKVSAQNRGETLALLADVSFGVSVAAAGAAVAIYFLSDDAQEQPAPVTIVPAVGDSFVGVGAAMDF